MIHQPAPHAARLRLDTVLTELALYAKARCPEAAVDASALPYEDEDGRVAVFPPPGLSDAEEERIEHALCARAADLFAETGLLVPCAVLDMTARAPEPDLPRAQLFFCLLDTDLLVISWDDVGLEGLSGKQGISDRGWMRCHAIIGSRYTVYEKDCQIGYVSEKDVRGVCQTQGLVPFLGGLEWR